MSGLLVSVRSAVEAAAALAGGADLIDVKEPAAGSLGAAEPGTIADVLRIVAGRAAVSAALGELRDAGVLARVATLPRGIRYAKLGLSRCAATNWADAWRLALGQLPRETQGVAVVYADWQRADAPRPREVLERAHDSGCTMLLVDTHDKSRGSLTEVWPLDDLSRFAAEVRRAGLGLVLAGSLRLVDVPRLARLAPDYFAVRGAVCRGGREAALETDLVRHWRDCLDCKPKTPAAATFSE